jgi:hypothetical protein
MKNINLNMNLVEVNTTTKPLRVSWNREIATDLSSYHGLNVDKHLNNIIKSEMRKRSINKIWKSKELR